MKRSLILLLALTLALTLQLKAEAFKVLHFHSQIILNVDGSFDVVEDILLEFSESKHGFIRKLPYRYSPKANVQGEIAEGHIEGFDYFTPITGITVEGREYTVAKEYSNYEIKIGSADEYVTGRQRYRIRYKVYNAINFFSNSSEFYWNVNGNDWDVTFDTLEATVYLPDKRKVADADIQVFTGLAGQKGSAAEILVVPGGVRWTGNTEFRANEGMTIVLRSPKGYLRHDPVPLIVRADIFVIDTLKAQLQLQDNGSIEVQETLSLNILRPQQDVVRYFPSRYAGTMVDGTAEPTIMVENIECRKLVNGRSILEYANSKPSEYEFGPMGISISSYLFPEAGTYQIVLKYRLWGATQQGKSSVVSYIPLFEALPDAPLAYAVVDFKWQGAQPVDLKNVAGGLHIPPQNELNLYPESLHMEFKKPLADGEAIHFRMQFPNKKMTLAPVPPRVLSAERYFTHYHVDYDIQADGRVHITNRFGYFESNWFSNPVRPIMLEYMPYFPYEFQPGSPQTWGMYGEYLVQNLEMEGEMESYSPHRDHAMRLAIHKKTGDQGIDSMRYSYDIFGILRDSAGSKWLDFPLVETLEDPCDLVSFTIRFAGGKTLAAGDIEVFVTPGGKLVNNPNIKYSFEPGLVDGVVDRGMEGGQIMLVKMRLPDGAVVGSFWLSLRLLWHNHKLIFLPLLLVLPLFLMWFFRGRDARFTTVVEFYPPEGLTPAEAGMLIDDKLHNRDLLALIYYWGAQGCMSITEIHDKDGQATDYQFVKLKNLPSTARKYEKTIFTALFKSGNSTKVSSHNQTFAGTMNKAREELNTYIKSKNFYMPGTQGWATALGVVGVLFGLVALVTAGMVFFRFSTSMVGRWDLILGWGGCAALLIGFGKIMPKKAGFGHAQYQKLVGFQEFVLRAEKDKLEKLVDTNPEYFGMTLPYAIALGVAGKWVDQFGDLLKAPPTYYHPGSGTTGTDYWQRQQFDLILRRQLDTMSQNFNSTPPSSSGGSSSSGSSYSSSSSSYSSSGSSGGSSYSSGGGSSGGGYGGGGGSSW